MAREMKRICGCSRWDDAIGDELLGEYDRLLGYVK
jgi:hypothetical protein